MENGDTAKLAVANARESHPNEVKNAAPLACTCHPDDRPEPCQRKHGHIHCWQAAVFADTRKLIVALKNVDRSPLEQSILNYAMRVERALELCV